jgi:DNA-binding HxlR family transcriptional regulator
MRRVSLAAMPCPIARSLDVVGDWWTLLIVRDALRGATRFEDLRVAGISDNILASRLRKLVEAGVMERRRYQTRPDRYEYLLTAKGRALGPIVAALRQWGREWTQGQDNGARLTHRACGHQVRTRLYCDHCGRPLEPEEADAGSFRAVPA